MATYTKSMIKKALSFWKTRLDESEKKETSESEEDQKKEAAAKAEDDGAEDTDAEDTDDADDTGIGVEDDFDPEADFDSVMGGDDDDSESDSTAQAGDDDADDGAEDGDPDAGNGGEDQGDDGEDSDQPDEEDPGEDGTDGEGDAGSGFKLEITAPSKKLVSAIPELCKKFGSKISVTVAGVDPEGEGEEGGYVTAIECSDQETLDAVKEEKAVKDAVGGMDGELDESVRYEPNTVGAVIKLLGKSDPRDYLFLRLAPNMKQCMIYDVDRRVMAESRSTTYMEIAVGKPDAE